MKLDIVSLRVLGALMEKEMTTPDAYPLSLNAIAAAANQRSSRDPLMDLNEDQVRGALHRLVTEQLVATARDGGRVPRYEHRIRTVLNLRRDETAILCVLLLRGAQTVGELRGRTERMHVFDDLLSVQSALDRLRDRETPVVSAVPRSPGSREMRWVHLLDGARANSPQASGAEAQPDGAEVQPENAEAKPASPEPLAGAALASHGDEAGMRDALRAALRSVVALNQRVEQLERRLDRLTASQDE